MTVQTETKTEAIDVFSRMAQIDLKSKSGVKLPTINEGEHIVGTMSENLQRLYWVRRGLGEEWHKNAYAVASALEAHNKLHLSRGIEEYDCEFFEEELLAIRMKASAMSVVIELIDEVFWGLVYLEYPELRRHGNIGIREGFQLVWTETDNPEEKVLQGLEELLENLHSSSIH